MTNNDQIKMAELYMEAIQPPSVVFPDMVNKVIQGIRQDGKISAAYIQRMLRVDYNTALNVFRQVAAKLKMQMPENPDIPVKVNTPTPAQQPQQFVPNKSEQRPTQNFGL